MIKSWIFLALFVYYPVAMPFFILFIFLFTPLAQAESCKKAFNPAETKALFDAVKRDNEEGVTRSLKNLANPNAVDYKHRSPLHFALSPEIVEILFFYRAHIDAVDNFGRTPLHWAALRGLTLPEKMTKEAIDEMGDTPFHFARSYKVAEALIKYGARFDQKDTRDNTPLHFARSLEIARFLIDEGGVDVNAQNIYSESPLHPAIRLNKSSIVKLLLEMEADPNLINNKNLSPLHLARSRVIVEDLINHGAITYLKDSDYNAPLHTSWNKPVEFAQALMENQANPMARNKLGDTPASFALKNGNLEVVSVLEPRLVFKPHSFFSPSSLDKQLIRSARNNNLNSVKSLLRKGAELEQSTDSFHRTALHWFSFWGNVAGARYVLNKGLKIDAVDNLGYSPLHIASALGYMELVKFLIKMGANVNLRDVSQRTPLELARFTKRNAELIEFLKKEEHKALVASVSGPKKK